MNISFKIGIVGPSRVGKTSLITSILEDTEKLLASAPVFIAPQGVTKNRIAQHHAELEGSLLAGRFNPGAVSGTEEPFEFNLCLKQIDSPSEDEPGIHFNLLDFPGGWLDSSGSPPGREKEWNFCNDWIKESTALLIPIESAVIMEAVTASQKQAIPSILTIYEVEKAALAWARIRALRRDQPALLMLCPVKCESYFDDNGGRRDRSKILLDEVRKVYGNIIQRVRERAPHVQIIYAPVDTIGCVEIIRGSWIEATGDSGRLEFTAEYRVRRDERRSVKGADAIFISLCRHLVEATNQVEEKKRNEKEEIVREAWHLAEKNEGFWKNIWLLVSLERKNRRGFATNSQQQLSMQQDKVERLSRTIMELARCSLGSRVKQL